MRVGLMIPCYIDMFYPEVGVKAVTVPLIASYRVGAPQCRPHCSEGSSAQLALDEPVVRDPGGAALLGGYRRNRTLHGTSLRTTGGTASAW